MELGTAFTGDLRERRNGKLLKWSVEKSPLTEAWLLSLPPVERMMWRGRIYKGMNRDFADIYEACIKSFVKTLQAMKKEQDEQDEIRRNRERTAREFLLIADTDVHRLQGDEAQPADDALHPLGASGEEASGD